MISFFVFLFCLCAVYTVYLFSTRQAAARRTRVGERLAEALDDTVGLPPPRAQLARSVSLSEMAWLDQLLRKNETAAELKRMIEQADLHLTVGRLVLFTVTATVLGMLMASMLVSVTALIIVAGALAGAVPSPGASSRARSSRASTTASPVRSGGRPAVPIAGSCRPSAGAAKYWSKTRS